MRPGGALSDAVTLQKAHESGQTDDAEGSDLAQKVFRNIAESLVLPRDHARASVVDLCHPGELWSRGLIRKAPRRDRAWCFEHNLLQKAVLDLSSNVAENIARHLTSGIGLKEINFVSSNRLVEMEAFVRVAQTASVSRAAMELGISPSLVSRRLKSLETRLGVRFVNRTTRQLSLTETGHRYLEFCKRIMDEIQEEERSITQSSDEPAGRLTVVAPLSFGIMEMGKAVTSFMIEYPEIQVTLIVGDNWHDTFDPRKYSADVLIRFTRPKTSTLLVRKLGVMRWVVCASPSYLRKAGVPQKPAHLAHHSCLITSRPYGRGIWRFHGPDGTESVKVSGVVSPSNAITMRYMVMDEAGIALLPKFCVTEDIQARRLIPILTGYDVQQQTICAFYPQARKQPKILQLFLKYLSERFKKAAWAERNTSRPYS